MALRRSVGLRNFCLTSGFATAFDGGTGRINIYTGSQPASADAAATGTLLATLTLASDAFGAASSGAVAINSVTSDSAADASGAPGYARFYLTGDTAPGSIADSDDRRMDCDATGTEITFSGLVGGEIVAGGTVSVSSFTYTEAAG